ncbi:MAG: ABC transporter ATP-binding protein [Actinobacteria bacterium]|nr:ABC transporter ATP-binding protein [Actinomycetota bacterium]
MTGPSLVATAVTKTFGGLRAVDRVSLTVPPGRITSLIGPNGAGKTTFFNCLTGLLEPDGGEITFGDRDISGLETHQRARLGIGRTFQRLEVFTGLSVFENLQVAAEAISPGNTFLGAFRLRHRADPEVVAQVESVLDRLDLAWAARRMAGDLPTGVLRLVELGRALCTDPKVLLLDELASGLDDAETEELAAALTTLSADGIGVLLIEHDIELVLGISQDVYVLDFGKVIAHGTPRQVAADPNVQAAYIGSERKKSRERATRSNRGGRGRAAARA